MYISQISNMFKAIPENQQPIFKKQMETFLLRTFKEDLKEKTERFLSIPSFGPLPIIENSVKYVPEILELYVNGFYASTVANT